jgi:hypothetical protein
LAPVVCPPSTHNTLPPVPLYHTLYCHMWSLPLYHTLHYHLSRRTTHYINTCPTVPHIILPLVPLYHTLH